MQESTTYQYIVEQGLKEGRREGRKEGRMEGRMEGQLEEARQMLLLVGELHLGKPTATVTKAVNKVDDVERVHRMSKRLLEVGSWKELLKIP
ncbi:MAG: hypothetical protein KY475_11760 [Planctomycetes bacterium]|nr:hypothetical protein [Planctomycetota bacterium]